MEVLVFKGVDIYQKATLNKDFEKLLIPSGITGEGGGGGGRVPPETSDWEISTDLPGKERQGKNWKRIRKEGKSKKGRCKIENGRRKKLQNEESTFLFLFLFCFHFSKPLKFVLGLPKWEFSSRQEKKNREKWLCPRWKIFLLMPPAHTLN